MFKARSCKIYHPDKGFILAISMASNRMFKHLAKFATHNVHTNVAWFQTTSEDLPYMCHCRYGHLGLKRPKVLFGDLKTRKCWKIRNG